MGKSLQKVIAITQNDIFGILARADLRAKHVLFADDRYMLPAQEWILGEFSASLRKWLLQMDIDYRPQDYDCDDFARFAATLAGLCHRRSYSSRLFSALAFGEMWYLRDGFGDGHAINVAIVAEDNKLPSLFFFEPQTCERVTLDNVQLATVEFIRF